MFKNMNTKQPLIFLSTVAAVLITALSFQAITSDAPPTSPVKETASYTAPSSIYRTVTHKQDTKPAMSPASKAMTPQQQMAQSHTQKKRGKWLYRDENGTLVEPANIQRSVARKWNEAQLSATRNASSRPTVHARNLYHVSAAMWDAWAAYDPNDKAVFHSEYVQSKNIKAAREEAISFAAYRVLSHRFAKEPNAKENLASFDKLMDQLGYDRHYSSTAGKTPAAVGNRIAQVIIRKGMQDGANEMHNYANKTYRPVNEPLAPPVAGTPGLTDPNRWQPLVVNYQQNDPMAMKRQRSFLGAEWGNVEPFALSRDSRKIVERDGALFSLYYDPGPPPKMDALGEEYYCWGFEMVAAWGAHLDHTDGVMWDISPASIGNAAVAFPDQWQLFYDFEQGGDWSKGYKVNPVTGKPYQTQMVPRGDYTRVVAEFWADGPNSETPPGHWFTILNYVSDHPQFEKRVGGEGPIVDDLEWDVKSYMALGGTVHDVAVAVWGAKGWYDYVRPISALRNMAKLGQRFDPNGISYHPNGVNLHPNFIEVITKETTRRGARHAHLKGHEGKIAFRSWRGPDHIKSADTDEAGIGWILAENWWPYQRPNFVTPPFGGYVSGHSTFSSAAAEALLHLTGSPYFPGGLAEYLCPEDEFLVFEDGPSTDVILQWASYRDASNQTSLSRIWGGIHPPADDLPGRIMGMAIGQNAFSHAKSFWQESSKAQDL